ncbi:hypothetical protein GJU94_08110 [Brucella sp. 10RB9214]|uniref:hypothetical protein n=1 Tax=Brucella sp. 10RB9214 TaxID=1844040 RepID=UPI0012ADC8FD|nr:hypothetical protein [Brucella sp. 10RB9214]MRN49796.1 hypothetical protein [Brucella sp. 10RB9214]
MKKTVQLSAKVGMCEGLGAGFAIDDDAWEEFAKDLVNFGTAVFSADTVDGFVRLSIENDFWKRDPEAKR